MFKNIVLHWTGGGYTPCSTDLEHYHYVIDNSGKIYKGKHHPRDNMNCIDGEYAAHCGGGNTGRIGIAICCRKDSNTPPTRRQIEAMCKLAAEVCKMYGLNPTKVITHAEFGITHPKTSSYGKVDINSIPYANKEGILECANYLRNKVLWYWEEQNG